MTIARTGNSIVDGAARGAARARAEESRVKAAAQKNAKAGKSRGGGGRSKSTAGAKAGRAAIKNSKGRGIAGSSHGNRAGAGKSIDYAINKEGARLISSNSGMDSDSIKSSFKLAQSMRPDISKSTGHMDFSLPPKEKLTDQQWQKVAEIIKRELDLDDGFPFIGVIHEDTDCQHIHLMYSRVSYDGRVHDDRFLKLRLNAVEDVIEAELKIIVIIPKEDFLNSPKYSTGEAGMAAREGVKPPRFVIQEAVQDTLKEKPKDPQAFIQSLAAKGVMARPAIKNGKMSGFSFQFNGVEFGASKISNEFGWKKLQEKINYESDKDDSKLAECAAGLPAKPQPDELTKLAGTANPEPEVRSAGEEVGGDSTGIKTPVKSQSNSGSVEPPAPAPNKKIEVVAENNGNHNNTADSEFVRRGKLAMAKRKAAAEAHLTDEQRAERAAAAKTAAEPVVDANLQKTTDYNAKRLGDAGMSPRLQTAFEVTQKLADEKFMREHPELFFPASSSTSTKEETTLPTN